MKTVKVHKSFSQTRAAWHSPKVTQSPAHAKPVKQIRPPASAAPRRRFLFRAK